MRTVRAETRTDQDARASRLFEEAKQLMDVGSFGEACAKLAESQALDSEIGTMLNLAYCDERIGKTASAWSMWLEAAAAAARANQPERVEFARERARLLMPRLLRVTIGVAEQEARGRIELRLDDGVIPAAEWGVPIPVDPGEHEVRASGAGLNSWARRFVAGDSGESSLMVPPLSSPEAMETPHPSEVASRRPEPLKIAAWVSGGVGVAAVGVAAAYGIAAIVKEKDATGSRNCVSDICNPEGEEERRDAQRNANKADVALAVGAGALVASSVCFWAASRQRSSAATKSSNWKVAPRVGTQSWSIALEGAW